MRSSDDPKRRLLHFTRQKACEVILEMKRMKAIKTPIAYLRHHGEGRVE